MIIVKEFLRQHAKKIIWGLILTAITLGLYWVFRKYFKK